MYNKVKTPEEIENIRESGRILATVLEEVEKALKPGVSGNDIDQLARKILKQNSASPAFLGYQGFPASICISVNDAVVHGIPNDRPFEAGDVVGFDFGVNYKGMITDAARTFIVGDQASSKVGRLVERTKDSLNFGIDQVKNGAKVGDISSVIENYVSQFGYGNVRDLVGHGVGHSVHEEPEIPNQGVAGTGATLVSGMTIAIEPMITLGGWQVVVDPDGWTIRTRDGSLAAHFEDTILVTDDGAEILTRL